MGASRSAVFRWGVRILAGLGVLPGQAMSQGAMAPGGSAVPPATRVAPPPPAPTLAPRPQVPSAVPPSTLLAPQPAAKSPLPAAAALPSRWSNAKALPSVGATWSGPGGSGRAVSDGTGTLSLGFLPQGTYDFAFETSGTGATQPSSRLLVGLVLPGGKRVRTASRPFTPGLKAKARIEVGPNGEARTIVWIWNDGRQVSTEEGEAPTWTHPGGRDTRLVFAVAADANTKAVR